jgi:hypothetical protein
MIKNIIAVFKMVDPKDFYDDYKKKHKNTKHKM